VAIRAFLFDFDGLILDTETASRGGWAWLYRRHGQELSAK
jgi:beta-phosphoglucomutase-like phosphatase (HAD superfamily)